MARRETLRHKRALNLKTGRLKLLPQVSLKVKIETLEQLSGLLNDRAGADLRRNTAAMLEAYREEWSRARPLCPGRKAAYVPPAL